MKCRVITLMIVLLVTVSALLSACGNDTKKESSTPTEAVKATEKQVIEDGVSFVLQPAADSDPEIGADTLNEIKVILERRLLGCEFSVDVDEDKKQFIVTVSEDDAEDVDIEALLTPVGRMTIQNTDGDVLMDNTDVASAEAYPDTSMGEDHIQFVIKLTFTEEGAEKFAALTKKYMNQETRFYIDDKLVSSPVVQMEITDGEAIIAGDLTIDEADRIAAQINADPLPFPLEVVESGGE